MNTIIKNFINIIILLSIFYTLNACNESSITPKTRSSLQLNNASQINSTGGNYVISFTPAIPHLPLNQYFNMDIIVMGATKQRLAYSVALEVDAGMKAHNHGMNVKPKIKALGNGYFKVQGMLLHMPGDWFLRFTVRRGAMSDITEVNVVVTP